MSAENTLTSWHSTELNAHALVRWAQILFLFSPHMQQSTIVFQGTVSTQTGSFHRLGGRQTHKLRKWLPSPWTDSHVSRPLLSWVKHVCSPGFVLCTWDMRNTAHTSGLMWGRDEAECQCLVSYTGDIFDKFLVLIPLFPQPMSTNKKWCSKNMVGPGRWLS